MSPVWAVYVRAEGQPWELAAVSVVSADRALGLAERDQARRRVAGAEYVVRQFAEICEVARAPEGAGA
jgi:hypothetical protein